MLLAELYLYVSASYRIPFQVSRYIYHRVPRRLMGVHHARRIDWEIGRGGFGKVFFGYRQTEGEDQDECDCKECSADKQVAIKLEK